MFELKKLISALLMPLPLLLMTGLFGLLFLWFSRRRFTASFLLSLSLGGILLLSIQPVSTTLLASIEQQYSGYTQTSASIDYIMVLGSGHKLSENEPITSQLTPTAVVRLAEGVRIHKLHPEARMIFSGYGGTTPISQATMMAKGAQALGVQEDRIDLLKTPKDTAEEAEQAAPLIGDKRVILVTSASHMPRALREFWQQGIYPIPAPTQFLAHNQTTPPLWKYAPHSNNLTKSKIFWHETLGRWWQKVRALF